MRHDLPDTVSGLEDRIQYLEWVAESCSRKVYERHIRPELDAAYAKLHRLKLEQIQAEARAEAERSLGADAPMRRAA